MTNNTLGYEGGIRHSKELGCLPFRPVLLDRRGGTSITPPQPGSAISAAGGVPRAQQAPQSCRDLPTIFLSCGEQTVSHEAPLSLPASLDSLIF